MFDLNSAAFVTTPCTRCLKCKGTRIEAETVRPHWNDFEADDEMRSTEVEYWWCDDCGDNVAIGLGAQNEITHEVTWLETYPDAANESTQSVEHIEPQQPNYEVRCENGQVAVSEIEGYLPTVDEALHAHIRPPLQVVSRSSALVFAWLVLVELHGKDQALDESIIFGDKEMQGDEILAALMPDDETFGVTFFRRTAEYPAGKPVAHLLIQNGKASIEALDDWKGAATNEQKQSLAPLNLKGLTPADGELYVEALLRRFSGGYLWAKRDK